MLFLLPTPLTDFLSKQALECDNLLELADSIRAALRQGPKLKKKTFGSTETFCLDLNRKEGWHRVLFERVQAEGKTGFKLSYFVWCHRYPKHLPQTRMPASIAHFECIDTQAALIDETETAMTYFQGNWFEPTFQQSLILHDLHLPQLIIGPPGSGKTFLIMRLMQEQAVDFLKNNPAGIFKMLYFTESGRLVNQMKETWKTFAKENLPEQDRVIATFITHHDYAMWYANEILKKDQVLIPSHDFIPQSLLGPGIAPQDVLDELSYHAYALQQDLKKGVSFRQSNYKNTGVKYSLFDEATRERLFPHFCNLLNQLDAQNQHVKGIASLRLPISEACYAYNMIFVDEAQNETLQTLMSLLHSAIGNQVLFFGDSLQNTQHRLCALPQLAAHCHQEKIDLHTEKKLYSSLRLHPQVATFANDLVLLYHTLRKGKVDSLTYADIQAFKAEGEASQEQAIFLYQEQEKTFQHIGQNPKAAVLVLDKQDKQEAFNLTQSHHLFTSEEVGGLEFELTLLFLSEHTLAWFETVNQAMIDLDIQPYSALLPKQHQSSQKQVQNHAPFALLSALLICISRTKGTLCIYFENPQSKLQHKVGRFLDWLRGKVSPGEQIPQALTQRPVSPTDWLLAIHALIQEGALEQAKGDLINHLQLSEQTALAYMKYCQTHLPQANMQAFEQWRRLQSPPPAQQTARPKPTADEKPRPQPLCEMALASQPAQAAPSLSALITITPLSDKLQDWVEQLYQGIDNEKNVETLFTNSKFDNSKRYTILFHHRMKNGLSLWLNLAFNQKMPAFLDKINKNTKIKQNAIEILNKAMDTCDDDLFFHASCILYASQLNQLLNRQAIDLQKPGLSLCTWFIIFAEIEPILRPNLIDGLFNQVKNFLFYQEKEGEAYTASLIQELLLVYPAETLPAARKHAAWIKEKLDQRITLSYHPFCGANLLYCLFRAISLSSNTPVPSDVAFIRSIPTNQLVPLVLNPITAGEEKGNSALSFMTLSCLTPLFTSALQNALFENHIQLFFRVNPEGGLNQKVNLFYYLSSSNTGMAILIKHWKQCALEIEKAPHVLFEAFTGEGSTVFYYLCSYSEGVELIAKYWESFSRWIETSPEVLFKPFTGEGVGKGTTPFFWLCANPKGANLLYCEWESFRPWIETSPEVLSRPITEGRIYKDATPFYMLFSTRPGRNLLFEHWESFRPWVASSPVVLFIPARFLKGYEGSSALLWLCDTQEGVAFLSKHWADFKRWIDLDPEALFRPIESEGPNGGITPFHRLCQDYFSFLNLHADDFKPWVQKHIPTLFLENKRCNPYRLLDYTPEGKALLKKWGVQPQFANGTQGFFQSSLLLSQRPQYQPDSEPKEACDKKCT